MKYEFGMEHWPSHLEEVMNHIIEGMCGKEFEATLIGSEKSVTVPSLTTTMLYGEYIEARWNALQPPLAYYCW